MPAVPRLCLAFALAIAALPASAILIRADRDDAEYLELATHHPASIALGAPDGEGVLIAPRWVLTAAHMARALQELKALPRLRIGDAEHEIAAMFVHPDWKPKGHSDLALLLLREPVRAVDPVPIYRERDEGGKAVVIVGHGYTGRIGERPVKERWDRKARAAINTVDRLSPRTLGLRIKPPEEASDLQGAAAPGDSGGPAFLKVDDQFFVAGIGYATDDANADGIVGNAGDWEIYARVSAYAEWIDATMFKAATDEARRLVPDRPSAAPRPSR